MFRRYDCLRSCETNSCTVVTSLYFVTTMVVGNFVLLNIFLAIVLQNAQADEDEENEEIKETGQSEAFAESSVKSIFHNDDTTPAVGPPDRGHFLPRQPLTMQGKQLVNQLNARVDKSDAGYLRPETNSMRLKRGAEQMQTLLVKRKSHITISATADGINAKFRLKSMLVQPYFANIYAVIALILW